MKDSSHKKRIKITLNTANYVLMMSYNSVYITATHVPNKLINAIYILKNFIQ